MGVDQSPGTTAVDTGDGTAAGVVPNTEVIAEINAVTIRRLGAVYLPPTAGGPAPSHSAPPQGEPTAPPPSADPGIETVLTTLRALGYRLPTPVRDALTATRGNVPPVPCPPHDSGTPAPERPNRSCSTRGELLHPMPWESKTVRMALASTKLTHWQPQLHKVHRMSSSR